MDETKASIAVVATDHLLGVMGKRGRQCQCKQLLPEFNAHLVIGLTWLMFSHLQIHYCIRQKPPWAGWLTFLGITWFFFFSVSITLSNGILQNADRNREMKTQPWLKTKSVLTLTRVGPGFEGATVVTTCAKAGRPVSSLVETTFTKSVVACVAAGNAWCRTTGRLL